MALSAVEAEPPIISELPPAPPAPRTSISLTTIRALKMSTSKTPPSVRQPQRTEGGVLFVHSSIR